MSTTVGLTMAISVADAESPYAGQERRSVKWMSQQDFEALEDGEGMCFAELAELNRFPGPKSVRPITLAY